MVVSADNRLSALSDQLLSAGSIRAAMITTAEFLGQELAACRVVAITTPTAPGAGPSVFEWATEPTDPVFDSFLLALSQRLHDFAQKIPHAVEIDDLTEIESSAAGRETLELLGLGQALAVTFDYCGTGKGTLLAFRSPDEPSFEPPDGTVLEAAAGMVRKRLSELVRADGLPPTPKRSGRAASSELRASVESGDAGESLYRRLVENSDAIIFTTNSDNIIRFVSRRALDFFGVIPEDFVGSIAVEWFDLIHLDDRERVHERAEEMQAAGVSFEEEFRVINHITGRERWLLVKLVPVRNEAQDITGWDGFGVDITGRREAQDALDVQSRKVRALYTVSSAIRGYLDPSNISARGLIALCDATGAEAGLCYLYPSARSRTLSLVAHHGFSAFFASRMQESASQPTLLRSVAEKGQSVVVSDMQSDPRAQDLLHDEEGFRSAVLVPIAAEEEIFGTLALFHRDVAKFDGGDVMLVAAAANQIGLAARQANLFSAYRKQTKNLSALYRMSHELSHLFSLEEIFHQSFTIIRDELGLKRLWLGLLNDAGTRIVGQSAYGPGWRRRLVEMNVELTDETNPLSQVILHKKALVVSNPDSVLGQLGLRRFFSRFAIKSLGLAPLISRGQVLGVLAVQPGSGEPAMEEEEITLLSSLANEIAALIFTKRLEERIAENEKMRSAGLLAAGIAHNFNNLLQAVLGQASLLEMQRKNEAQVLKAAKIISESATKGAALVKQLLSFANLEEPHPSAVQVNELIEAETKNWSQLLEPNQQIKLSLKHDLPRTSVDTRHFLRIITALMTNACEAMRNKGGPIQIFTDSVSTDQERAHIEVPEGQYVRVGVRDSGIGMDAETKRRCFEPFFTTKNVDPSSGLSLSGAGLGLAAAYALARKNGGRLVVDSRLGHGSVFTLYLPIERTKKRESSPSEETRSTVAVAPQIDSQSRAFTKE
ncbi:MAG: GAF domain-containing protein [Bdellovibrionota bacterium]